MISIHWVVAYRCQGKVWSTPTYACREDAVYHWRDIRSFAGVYNAKLIRVVRRKKLKRTTGVDAEGRSYVELTNAYVSAVSY